uniref:Uncharacterized protein n=1 Tax=Beta vulgaris TaxID=161934 RepID=K4Q1W5_BETVU|nr:hypothetical protein [Beta vulgaris]
MAESIVASAVQWIGSLLVQETSILFGVDEQVRGLQQELELMQQYVQDADARQGEGDVRTLIRQIRQLAYDAEDVIDIYIFKDEWRHAEHRLIRLAGYIYSVRNTYRVGKQINVIQGGVKRITERLNDCGMRKTCKLWERHRLPHDEGYWRRQPPSFSHDDNNGEHVVGLEKDIRKLVEVLMGEGNTQVNVVSIVGMGGSGKTTLARKLYNHPYAKECFDCTAWVFISQEWRTEHVLLQILRKVGSEPNEKMIKPDTKLSVEELVDKLRNILEQKSYLVVLDDVWRREALEEILPAFPREDKNKRGSKIIITTRNREIIQFQNLQQNLYIHEPRPLNEEEDWELLNKLALSRQGSHNVEDFERLGKEMLKKCGGLPLAIAALAGILNTRESIAEWQQVNEAVRSRVMENTQTNMGRSVRDLLALSYDDLPYDLKPCFLYLCVFPEDCQIPVGMLTRMWIAEGLVAAHEEMSLEDVAMQLVEELSHRFMIKIVRTNFKGAIKAIQLHDLLRDLCVRKAKEENFVQIYTATSSQASSCAFPLATQPRRAALHSSILLPAQDSNLRSLVLLTRSSIVHSAYVSKETLDLRILHKNFKLLRLLNLWGIKTATGTLPTEIGELIHLRYLAVRASNITELPRSIGKLRNLMTLDYRNIDSDNNIPVQIPNVFINLVLLRNLFLPIENAWSLQRLQVSGLKNLRTLWGVKSEEEDIDWFSREIVKLSPTLKKLKVIVSTTNDLEASFNCPSLILDRLNTFHCQWGDGIVLQHVNKISHNRHLHKLVLVGPIHAKLKLSVMLPCNLVMLELRDSILHSVDPMVAIGALTHLKLLRLFNTYTGNEFLCKTDSFPVLEELYLESLPNLNLWTVQIGAMVSLKKVEILWCKKLQQFPQGLAFITTLQQLEFLGMPEEFGREAKESGWSRKGLKLPQNMEAIIEQCDARVDISSISKLYAQLTAGVFLNNKKQASLLPYQ